MNRKGKRAESDGSRHTYDSGGLRALARFFRPEESSRSRASTLVRAAASNAAAKQGRRSLRVHKLMRRARIRHARVNRE